MQRLIVLCSLSIVLLAACFSESDACWRRQRSCRSSCAPLAYYSPHPLYYPETVPAIRVPVELTPHKSASGRTYRVFDTLEAATDAHDRPERWLTTADAGSDMLLGAARKVAKTSISSAPTKVYANLSAVLDSLVADDEMRAKDLKDKPRVDEEDRNVTVAAFIYAVKKEADNDFHVILGSTPAKDGARFMTAEVSGLPAAGPFKAPLKAVRDKFKSEPALAHVRTTYIKFDPPIPVSVKGSLFYDIDHPPSAIGPSGLRPKTAWEIHPVTDIEFEP